ncbi:MAG: hypothetical protein H7122_03805 [Chitinophagaceae bacterium]|nr:hypothetical protein [Chitinophagaceae bacterium]
MKLTLLFAKFLYQHKQLNLPGIGVFSIDPSVTIPEITDKNSHELVQQIRFTQKSIAKPDEEFIEFIRTQTGKIRPLAESDLESFLSDGKILLNIGKPFHLEGIGTLQKSRAGAYEFYPGLPLLEKLENFLTEKETKASASKKGYEQEYNSSAKSGNSGRAIWIVLAILVGLGAIIWGGYSLYNNNTDNEGSRAAGANPVQPVIPAPDTAQSIKPDSVITAPDSAVPVNTALPAVKTYKFIFRLASRNYVMKRYNDLKPANPNLYWDTKDSFRYRLYMAIPAAPADTSRIRDSLQLYYGTKKVIIE